jgi:phosphoribosylaminoimidazole-succinocarboxamide synthase
MVVRGYLTGSAWRDYQAGNAVSGIRIPAGMQKNQRFEEAIITPSTKAPVGEHDIGISREDIIAQNLVEEATYRRLEEATLALFKFGQEFCARNNLILVDCKFEFGVTADDEIVLVDEIFTPDASRFWILDTYQGRFERGEDPEILDKEFFRQWLIGQGFMGDGPAPAIPDEVKVEFVKRYVQSYEMITGQEFKPAVGDNVSGRIKRALGL